MNLLTKRENHAINYYNSGVQVASMRVTERKLHTRIMSYNRYYELLYPTL